MGQDYINIDKLKPIQISQMDKNASTIHGARSLEPIIASNNSGHVRINRVAVVTTSLTDDSI